MSTQHPTREELASLLAFYAEAGLDFAVLDAPVNRFEAEKLPRPAAVITEPAAKASQMRRENMPAAPDAAPARTDAQIIAEAERLAHGCDTIDALRRAVEGFDGCPLKRMARHTLFDAGPAQADLMIILQAPTRDDDATGQPHQGEAGRLLGAMLAAIGLDRDTAVHVGFSVPWHPPGDQPPTPRQLAVCRPFLARQIALVQPKLVLAMVGNAVARDLFGDERSLMHMRGKLLSLFGKDAMASFSPQFLLVEPSHKRAAWQDLMAVRGLLSQQVS